MVILGFCCRSGDPNWQNGNITIFSIQWLACNWCITWPEIGWTDQYLLPDLQKLLGNHMVWAHHTFPFRGKKLKCRVEVRLSTVNVGYDILSFWVKQIPKLFKLPADFYVSSWSFRYISLSSIWYSSDLNHLVEFTTFVPRIRTQIM